MEDKKINQDQVEQRSLTTTLLASGVGGAAAGTANVLAQQAIDKLKRPKK